MSNRDWDNPQYKRWRMTVKKRDGFKCKKCGSKTDLHCHHIKKWSKYPELKYLTENGITLCAVCHRAIWGKEELWESTCLSLIGRRHINMDVLWTIYMDEEAKPDEQ